MYKMTLADETEIEFAGVNGNNFIVPDKKEMDTSVFSNENLKTGKIEDGEGNVYEFENLAFTQEQKQANGDYYICFHELTEQEVKDEEIIDLLVQVAEIEVEAGSLELESISGSLQEAVRVKIDDSKRLDK